MVAKSCWNRVRKRFADDSGVEDVLMIGNKVGPINGGNQWMVVQ